MALVHNVNVGATSGDQMIYLLLTTLLSAGWTVPSSSDGTTYNASGNQLTGSGSGAGGLGNTSAWFVVRDPSGRREFCFQRGTANTSFRAKYSALSKFSGGSPSATRVPAATDEQVILGAGSDASPTYVAHFVASPTGRFHVVTTDTAENGVFWFWYAQINSSIVTQCFMLHDALKAGTTRASDADPCYVANNAAAGASSTMTFANLVTAGKAWTRYGLSGAAWATSLVGPAAVGTFFGPASGGVANPYSGEDDAVECLVGALAVGYKGRSAVVKGASIVRAFPATWNLADANLSSVRIDGTLLRWPTAVAPLS
jgi:hypothetical protein